MGIETGVSGGPDSWASFEASNGPPYWSKAAIFLILMRPSSSLNRATDRGWPKALLPRWWICAEFRIRILQPPVKESKRKTDAQIFGAKKRKFSTLTSICLERTIIQINWLLRAYYRRSWLHWLPLSGAIII